jgi:periplasmic protein TonB
MFDNLRHTLDFDDLLFEKRNRDYGAYQLRKKYNAVIIGGIITASLIVCSLVIIPFILTTHNERIMRGGIKYVKVQMNNLQPPEEQIYVPPPPPPPSATRVEEIVRYVPPVVVDSVPLLEKSLATFDEALGQKTTDITAINGTGKGDNLTGQDGTESDEPFVQVEVMPSFKGGDINKFRDWIGKKTRYPQEAVDKKIRGKVFLTFIVEKDGSVSNVTVVKGVFESLDKEAEKAISESPKWTPGLQRGQPVRVRFSISLNFQP